VNLVWAERLRGRSADVVRRFEADGTLRQGVFGYGAVHLAEAQLRLGQRAEARRTAEEGLSYCERIRSRLSVSQFLRLLGQVAAAAEEQEEATRRFDAA